MGFEKEDWSNSENSNGNDSEIKMISQFMAYRKTNNFEGMERIFFDYENFVNTCEIMVGGFGDRAPYNQDSFKKIKTMYLIEKSQRI